MGVISSLRVEQAAGLQGGALGVAEPAVDGGDGLALDVDGFHRALHPRLELGHGKAQRFIAGGNVGGLGAGDPALAISVVEAALDAVVENVVERGLRARRRRRQR